MRVISKRRLREFWETEKQAELPLDTWYRTALKASWQNLSEVKADYPSVDLVGKCLVFNIGGNKFRLIVKIEFLLQVIYIKFVLTHKEYDKDVWKKDC
ncbi:MAG TPA: type II toxin-antitoxin system HigB family toxin [Pyrinomonadaceae bacterium]|nr:type II toxin-antitoxin system HigB family toxin [Pyrinomonadaceae bacterium]